MASAYNKATQVLMNLPARGHRWEIYEAPLQLLFID